MEKTNLQNQNIKEEIAEEFGTHRPALEKDISARIGSRKKAKKGEKQDEKAKKLQSESKHSS